MLTNIDFNTPLATMTLGQLADYLDARDEAAKADANCAPKAGPDKKYVYGLKGIMDLFKVSNVTAQRYKKRLIREAVSQQGRIIVVDADKAMELFKSAKRPVPLRKERRTPLASEPSFPAPSFPLCSPEEDFGTLI